MRAFLYARNSKGKRGTATRDQEADGRRDCERRGWGIAGVFVDDGISASRYSKKERSDYDEMIRRMRAGECDVLVYWEASRAYRNMRTYLDLRDLCEETHVLLCYNGHIYDMSDSDDRYRTGQDALKAENGADEIRNRNLRTHRLAAERGAPVSVPAYGYRREYDPSTGFLIGQVEDEETAPIVQRIFHHVYAGKSKRSIVTALNSEGVPALRGAPRWEFVHVANILKNPTYKGKRTHHGVVVADALWDALVPEVVWDAVQPAPSMEQGQRENAVKYLLTHIGLCGKCAPYVYSVSAKPYPNQKMKYICRHCFGTVIPMAEFDDIVENALITRIEKPEFVNSLKRSAETDAMVQVQLNEVAELEGQLAQARKSATTIINGRPELSVKSLVSMERLIEPQIERIRESLEGFAAVPAELQYVAGPGARERWKTRDLRQKRALIRGLMEITIHPAGRGARVITPERYTIEWLR